MGQECCAYRSSEEDSPENGIDKVPVKEKSVIACPAEKQRLTLGESDDSSFETYLMEKYEVLGPYLSC